MGRLDPVAPDRLVFIEGLANDGVANERSAVDWLRFEPVLAPAAAPGG